MTSMIRIKPEGKGRGYSGSESYKYIDNLIEQSGKGLKIVSPFIGPAYAKMLVRQSEKKQVYVITMRPFDGRAGPVQAESLEILKKARASIGSSPSAFFALLTAVSVALKLYSYAELLFAITIAVATITLYLWTTRKSRLMLKIVNKSFVHEKLYIGDKIAIVGSANLTVSGTRSNIEHIEIIKDPERVRELSRHFDSLWSA